MATDQLKSQVHHRAVEVANDVLARALHSGRRSLPLRAHPPHEHIQVSEHVLISRLRLDIDDGVPGAAVGAIFVRVARGAHLEQVTIELFVQFGQVLMEVADRVRTIAARVMVDVLGPAAGDVSIVLTHVHVSDVTRGDPHLVEPSEEVL